MSCIPQFNENLGLFQNSCQFVFQPRIYCYVAGSYLELIHATIFLTVVDSKVPKIFFQCNKTKIIYDICALYEFFTKLKNEIHPQTFELFLVILKLTNRVILKKNCLNLNVIQFFLHVLYIKSYLKSELRYICILHSQLSQICILNVLVISTSATSTNELFTKHVKYLIRGESIPQLYITQSLTKLITPG